MLLKRPVDWVGVVTIVAVVFALVVTLYLLRLMPPESSLPSRLVTP